MTNNKKVAFWVGSSSKKGYPYIVVRFAMIHTTKDGRQVWKPTGISGQMERSGSRVGKKRMNEECRRLEQMGCVQIERAWQEVDAFNITNKA